MSDLLASLRMLDKRHMTSEEDLVKIAKMYNVKAQIWRVGIPLKKIDRAIFQELRETAVTQVLATGGGTIDDLCKAIERLIDEGRCGLGKGTYMPKNRQLARALSRARAQGFTRG